MTADKREWTSEFESVPTVVLTCFKRMSSARVGYIPALCTQRPSILPIEWLSEAFGLAQGGRQRQPRVGKFVKLGHLEEVKVVTRSP